MSDFARLEDKLTKLRSRERTPGEARKLRGQGSDALLAALVTEIDETILPRQITLTISGGPVVHLAVVNRKLQALLAPAPAVEGSEAVVGEALSDAEVPAVAAVRAVLAKAFDVAEDVTISATRLSASLGSDVGVPAPVLARAWGLAETAKEAVSPVEVLDGFVKALGDDAIAWLRIDGEEVSGQGGDAAVVESLGEKAAMFLDGYFGKLDQLFPSDATTCATIVAPRNASAPAVLFIEHGEVSAFVAVAPGQAAKLAGRWQKLVAE